PKCRPGPPKRRSNPLSSGSGGAAVPAAGSEPPLESVYAAFSCPSRDHVAALDRLVPLIVREYSAGVCASFVGRHAERIEAASRGLIEYLGSWFVDPAAVADDLWDYGFGNLY